MTRLMKICIEERVECVNRFPNELSVGSEEFDSGQEKGGPALEPDRKSVV